MAYITCPIAQIQQQANGNLRCNVPLGTVTNAELDSIILQVVNDNPPVFDVSQIDPSVATGLFTAGFLLAITPWATAWGFSQLLKLVR